MAIGHVTKGNGHSQRISVNASAGVEISVEFSSIPTSGDPLNIETWSQIEIHPIGIACRMAWIAGEIAAGRYFTLPADVVRTIVGPGMARRLFLLSDGAAGIVEVEVFE